MIITNQSQTQFDYTLPDGSTHTETKDSNIVNTEVINTTFTKVKTSDKTFLQEDEVANQTVTLTNNSQHNATDLFFTDTLSDGAEYVPNSVIVNGVAHPEHNLITGFSVGDLPMGGVTTVNYQIKANNPATNVSVNNFATLNYNIAGRNLTDNSNTVTLALVSNRLEVVKAVDKNVAVSGEILHYTSTITNTGTLPKSNLIFTDTIPTGTTFVPNSVKINGVQQVGFNPEAGFGLPNLGVGENVIVEFDVEVL